VRSDFAQLQFQQFLPQSPALLAHCRRVAALAVDVADNLQAPEETVLLAEQAALLHHLPVGLLEGFPADSLLSSRLHSVLCHLAGMLRHLEAGNVRLAAEIVEVCDLLDEQIEFLPIDSQDLLTFHSDLEELAFGGFLNLDVVAAVKNCSLACSTKLEKGIHSLPVNISVVKTLRLLNDGPEQMPADLAKMASGDPVLAASLISAANSALLGSRYPISQIRHAVDYLGTDTTRRILVAAALRPLMVSVDLYGLWRHSIEMARLCQAMAAAISLDPDVAMLLGLVHDMGRIAVQCVGRPAAVRYARLVEKGCPPAYAEKVLFRKDHGEIGAQLLTECHFSEEMIEAVRRHHQPERSESKWSSLLYLGEHWSETGEDLPSRTRLQCAFSRTGITTRTLEVAAGAEDGPLQSLLWLS
jgi:putative nucleotidyltransferase with HDIG domain